MERNRVEQEITEILRIISLIGDQGVKSGEINDRLEVSLNQRALQRRLKKLIGDNRIASRGTGRGKRYFPISKLGKVESTRLKTYLDMETGKPTPLVVREDTPEYGAKRETIELSEAALLIRDSVTAPLTARRPVGYDGTFLEAYRPNETFYLSAATRASLYEVGNVGVPDLPAGTYVRQVMDRLLIDLSWNSSRLEGNTYSLLETERLLQGGEAAGNHDTRETQMILNHKAAIEMLAEDAGEIAFNRYTICNLHALLSDNLMMDGRACGALRERAVGISGTVFHPLEVPQLVEQRFLEILEKAEMIENPFEQAFFVMVHLPYLQPFEDVNKRVSRLAANIPLVKQNLCPLSFVDVPQEAYVNGLIGVYELRRVDYLRDVFVWAYKRSAARYSAVVKSLGEPDPFRLEHRALIRDLVRAVVQRGMGKVEAAQWISLEADMKLRYEQERLREVVETELLSLHVGNIARYKLRPSEYGSWQVNWK